MKGFWWKVFKSGAKATIVVAIVWFIVRFVTVEFLAPLWKPLISAWWEKPSWFLSALLMIGFALLTVIILGLIVEGVQRNEGTRRAFKKVLGKTPFLKFFVVTPEDMKDKPACLVEFAPGGTYFIAALIKEIKLKRVFGETVGLCILYAPGVPLPMSGFPIIFALRKRVIPLKLSFGAVYRMTTSFGSETPEVIEELDTLSTG